MATPTTPSGAPELQGAKETFHGGVVKTIASAAHAGRELVALENRLILKTGVLAAAIRVMHRANWRLTAANRHVQGGDD